MKILFIIETLGRGGAEQVLVNILPELQKEGIECEVAILFDPDDLAKEFEKHNIKVHHLHLSYKWNVIEGFLKLNKLVRSNKYDIIHAHLFFAYFYTGIVKIFNPKIKTVTTFHNLGYNTYPANTILKKFRKKLDSFIVNKLIDKKVAVSNAVKKHFEKHLKIPKVDVIYNSFPLEKIEKISSFQNVKQIDILKNYVDVNNYDFFSITPGRLVKEKGHIYLLEAIEKLNKKNVKLCHFIVGYGPLEEYILNEIKNRKLINVILIPGLPQKELFSLIKACDFVVIPSISEGFGMVVGEAMALGKAIVATEIDGIIDLVENGKNGLLVPVKDSKALANAIVKLSNDFILREKLAKNAKEKIKQFDTKIIAKQWKKYYEEMLNE
jgi:glycosyltransferase involved in cell wall biosynthesis